ncbi:MAG TPA: hypothetical protein VK892_06910 [Pyrinomonadaceae bacterium]|nr:hypothetical protein [Pyrinomonadaceae bacterium]
MAKKTLTIEGITFPKYKSGSSKRNFRLVFFIEYVDSAGQTQAVMVTKPAEGQWKWGNSSSKFPIFPEGNDLGDSVELNLIPMRAGQNKFNKSDSQIAEIDGEIVSIGVNFVDVFDSSIMDILRDNVLPEFVNALQKSGFNPVNFIPGMGIADGIIRGTIDKNFKFEDVVNKGVEFLQNRKKDKILYNKIQPYNGEKMLSINGRKEWEKGKTGTYEVKIGVK